VTGPPVTGPPDTLPAGSRLEPLRLPNNRVVVQLNAAETSLQYKKIVADRMYLQHGLRLAAGAVVFDVGANIGIASLFFHWEAGSVRVFAFEPAAEMHQALVHNLLTHQVDHVALACALGARPASQRLTVYPNNTSMSGVYADAEHDRAVTRTYLHNTGFDERDIDDLMAGLHASYDETCEITTLSAVIDAHRVPRIDLLKVNVEKAEADVLDGIRDEHWPLVRQAVIQVHDIDGRVDLMREALHSKGFRTVVTQEPLLSHTDIFDLFARR
jgi:FkbM family methyltransferase